MEKISFEAAIEQLETLVVELETGAVTLEEGLSKYERGIALAKMCAKTLQEAEKKVEVLRKKEDGTFTTAAFIETRPSGDDAGADEPKIPRTKKRQKSNDATGSKDAEDFFLT